LNTNKEKKCTFIIGLIIITLGVWACKHRSSEADLKSVKVEVHRCSCQGPFECEGGNPPRGQVSTDGQIFESTESIENARNKCLRNLESQLVPYCDSQEPIIGTTYNCTTELVSGESSTPSDRQILKRMKSLCVPGYHQGAVYEWRERVVASYQGRPAKREVMRAWDRLLDHPEIGGGSYLKNCKKKPADPIVFPDPVPNESQILQRMKSLCVPGYHQGAVYEWRERVVASYQGRPAKREVMRAWDRLLDHPEIGGGSYLKKCQKQ
jgi:hypothetical protein